MLCYLLNSKAAEIVLDYSENGYHTTKDYKVGHRAKRVITFWLITFL